MGNPKMLGLIAAVDSSGLIGADDKIPWKYSEDLKRFRDITMGSTLIMGSKTFLSLPKPLDGRYTVVLTRDPNFLKRCRFKPDSVVGNLKEGLEEAHVLGAPVWIGGGAEVYRQCLSQGLVDYIDLTFVPVGSWIATETPTTLTFFPMSFLSSFKMVREQENPHDPRLSHRRYEKI
jgi:dihydrofolate reductase